jgi:hypothetical protein
MRIRGNEERGLKVQSSVMVFQQHLEILDGICQTFGGCFLDGWCFWLVFTQICPRVITEVHFVQKDCHLL